jgi:medium-chain acyl-[acyl-carrier-protein] hydrolase
MSSWFVKSDVKSDVGLKLFAFGYSGAHPVTFAKWSSLLQPEVQVVAISLPGRGNKPTDPNVKCVADLAEPIATAIMEEVGVDVPFIFYGHSFGGLLSWLVITLLRERDFRLPQLLIVGGKEAPMLLSKEGKRLALAGSRLSKCATTIWTSLQPRQPQRSC